MSKESVKAFVSKMSADDDFAKKIIDCKNTEERIAVARAEGFDFLAAEFNEMAKSGEIDIDQMLAHLARTYEGKGIRLFVRPGVGLFE
jgi:predicted ribosomally synthesized peptide with nif11-like leader